MKAKLMNAFLGLVLTQTAFAQIVYVDDDAPLGGDGASWATAYNSLSSALTAAQPSDQVWVAAGTYVGNFTLPSNVQLYGGFSGSETDLSQRDWMANLAILDGGQTGSVVTSLSGATDATRIDGFTITNGIASYGGGLYLGNSSPTIANNTIAGNFASAGGGGLYLYGSSALIINNTVMSNTITGTDVVDRGGGLYLKYSSPTIADNTIKGNSGNLHGGGLYLEESSPTIANNTITGNWAVIGGG